MLAAVAVAGCGDVLAPNEQFPLSALLVLPLQSAAPAPPTVAQWIRVGDPVTQVIALTHSDNFLTPYAEVRFPSGSLDGVPAGDSVLVTVQPRAGSYGVTVSAPGADFSAATPPTVRFSYGRYGDFAVIEGSASYDDATAYAAALDVWEEATLDRWAVAAGSGAAGTDAVTGRLDGPGTVLVAAPR